MATKDILLELIDDNPYNPRQHYPRNKVDSMAYSLRQMGQLEVPKAREANGRVQLCQGHLRKRAFLKNQKADPEHWKTMRLDIEEISEQEMFYFSLEENLQRADISPLEIARSIDTFLVLFPEETEEKVGKKFKMGQANVANMRRVLRLPEKILEKIDDGRINFTQGRELIILDKLDNPEECMLTAVRSLKTENRPYGHPNTVDGMQLAVHHEIKDHCRPLDKEYEGYRYSLVFDTRAAGCLNCDKMLRTHPTKSAAAHYCNDSECWEKKQQEHRDIASAEAKAQMEADVLRRTAEKVEASAGPPGKMETYRIQNMVTRKWYEGEATSLDAACRDAGWNKEDCWARVKTKKGGWAKISGHMPTTPPPADISQEIPVGESQEARYYLNGREIPFEEAFDEDGRQKDNVSIIGKDPSASIVLGESYLEVSREKANLERPVGELPCDTCAKKETCDRSNFHVADDDSGRLVCGIWEDDHVSGAIPIRTLPKEPANAVPEDLLELEKARNAAGTRAEILDLNDICTYPDSWRRQVNQGYVLLQEEFRLMDDPEECTERCIHGFHFAFDSKSDKTEVLYICSDPKCVGRKKSVFTRNKNAAGQARKKAEMSAVKEAIAQTATLDRPRIKLILLAQMIGFHTERYYYGGTGTKKPEKWLWDKVSAGTAEKDRTREKLFKAIDKLSDEALAKLVVDFMFYYLTDKGDIGSYEIKVSGPLEWIGIPLQLGEKDEQKPAGATSRSRVKAAKIKTEEA